MTIDPSPFSLLTIGFTPYLILVASPLASLLVTIAALVHYDHKQYAKKWRPQCHNSR